MIDIDNIAGQLTAELSKILNSKIRSVGYESIAGGSINDVYKLVIDGNLRLCCKINSSNDFPGMFETESHGLSLLGSTGTLRVPQVLGSLDIAGSQVLITEWVETASPSKKFWELFGEKLALLHTNKGEQYGLHYNNYMGALPQSNLPGDNWNEFFFNQRIVPQVKMAVDNKLMTAAQAKGFDRLQPRLPVLFPDPRPVLLHGDLWSGNFLCSAAGEPVLIDPAVYYGHPSIDLAMTTLFGGFDKAFYDSYHYHQPIAPNHTVQWNCCNLYPLLIHLNLFGSSYLGRIMDILKAF